MSVVRSGQRAGVRSRRLSHTRLLASTALIGAAGLVATPSPAFPVCQGVNTANVLCDAAHPSAGTLDTTFGGTTTVNVNNGAGIVTGGATATVTAAGNLTFNHNDATGIVNLTGPGVSLDNLFGSVSYTGSASVTGDIATGRNAIQVHVNNDGGFPTSNIGSVTINHSAGTLIGQNGIAVGESGQLISASRGDVVVNMSGGQIGTSAVRGSRGIEIGIAGSANATVTTAGPMFVTDLGIGVGTQDATATGNILVNVNNVIDSNGGGVGLINQGSGATTVNIASNIIATNGAVGVTTAGPITVNQTAGSLMSGNRGIDARSDLAGVTVAMTGSAQIGTAAQRADVGIIAYSAGASGNVNVTARTIFASGNAIDARITEASSGNLSVTLNGPIDVSGTEVAVSAQIATNANTGSITLVNNSTVTAPLTEGIRVEGGVANTVTNTGSVNALIGLRVTGAGVTTLVNDGGIAGTDRAMIIREGTLRIVNGTGTFTGKVEPGEGGILVIDRTMPLQLDAIVDPFVDPNPTSPVLAAVASGAFVHNGSGTTTISGTGDFSGTTTVNGGTLIVNGSLANSAVTVNAGGRLGGNGTVGPTTVNGGTLAPGASTGTLKIEGSLVMSSAAAYIVEVSPTAADRTDVTTTATLAGNLSIVATGGTYQVGKQYVLLHADGGRTGTFTTGNIANVFGPAIRAVVNYTANEVILDLTSSGIHAISPLLPPGAPQNVKNVAAAVDAVLLGGNPPAGFLTLMNFPPEQQLAALSKLTGEVATGAVQANIVSMGMFLNAMLNPFADGRGGFGAAMTYAPERAPNPAAASAFAAFYKAPPMQPSFAQRWSVWGTAYGGRNRTDGDASTGSADLSASAAGFAGGVDYRISSDSLIGAAIAIGESRWRLADSRGGGKTEVVQAGGYASTRWNELYLSAAVAGAWHRADTGRTVTVAGTDRLEADFNAQALGARIEAGRRFMAGGFGARGYGVTPYAALQIQSLRTPSYRETAVAGSDQFALAYKSETTTDTRSEVGLWFDSRHALDGGALLTLRTRAAWVHDFDRGRRIGAAFQTLPGASFVVNGAAAPDNLALLSGVAELRLANGVTLSGRFDGEFAAGSWTYAGMGTVKYAW